jgi:hypothetical protein
MREQSVIIEQAQVAWAELRPEARSSSAGRQQSDGARASTFDSQISVI